MTSTRLGAWQLQLVPLPSGAQTASEAVSPAGQPLPAWGKDQHQPWPTSPPNLAPPPPPPPPPAPPLAAPLPAALSPAAPWPPAGPGQTSTAPGLASSPLQAEGPLGDLSQLGPHRVRKTTITLPTRDGGTTEAEVYLPQTDRPSAPVIHAYGMLQNPGRYAGTATHYASWGLTVIVPKLPHPSGAPIANAQEIQGFVDAVMQRPAALGPNLDTSRGVGLSGHSFGALTVLLGAGGARNVGAVVAMDPADNLGQGKLNGHKIQAPTAFVVGKPEVFNQFGNGFPIHDRIQHPNKEMIRVRGASHMDFQNEKVAGPKNRENAVAMKFATAFLLHQLQGDARAAAWTMNGAGVQEARRLGEIR